MIDAALRQAFEETDAVCRRYPSPTDRQLFFRAMALLALGDAEAAIRDLDRALAGPADLDVLAARFHLRPSVDVARAIWSSSHGGDALACRAAALLLEAEPLVLRAERTQVGVRAVLACAAGPMPTVEVDGTALPAREVARDPTTGVALFRVHHAVPSTATPRVEAKLGGRRASASLPPRAMATARPSSLPGVVSVVVPVHAGRDATRACLAALAEQDCRLALDMVVVDDACPDGDLAAETAAAAAGAGWRLVRNEANLGFAASVNRGAALSVGGHLLLLNADAILPAGAIDRMLAAAAMPGVGTVSPFSNDGGFTSFPLMRRHNPVPDEGEAGRIDDAARRAASHLPAAGRAIDIPAGTGFCLLVAGPCWDALGGLDLGYGRGYFEDVDLCLRARRIGYRTVLAPDVYVRHLGGQSFGTAKNALVADNARLLVERFPSYEADWMAFAEGDPLAAVRHGIDRLLPPPEPVHLVAGRRASLDDLPAAGGDDAGGVPRSTRPLFLHEVRGGAMRLRAPGGAVPQDLCFGPHERADWASYMCALTIEALTLVDPSDDLVQALDAVVPAAVPVALVVAGPRSLRLLDDRAGLLGRARADARDGMGRAALGLPVSPLPSPRAPVAGPPRLAALVPWPSVRVDRWLVSLDRALRAGGGEVVILGEAVGARARPTASGAMAREDYPDALRHRAITHLLLPDVEAPFGLVEELRDACPLPAAYVDWAPGRHRPAPGDLALPPDGGDGARLSAVAAWCLAGTPGAGARA